MNIAFSIRNVVASGAVQNLCISNVTGMRKATSKPAPNRV